MQIIEFPHPTLRHVSKPLRRVDAELRRIVAEMFDLMYQAKGVGLAANQVDLPYRLFIANPEGDASRKDLEMVFINPVISQRKGMAEAEEGCLSLPGLYGKVKRPDQVHIHAWSLEGQEISLDLKGFMARIVQHETDHLDGVLFIDKLSPLNLAEAAEDLDDFAASYQVRRQSGEIPDDRAIAARLAELERLRC